MRKRIILFLAANPSGTTELALAREAMTIGEELQRYGQGGNFEFRTRKVTQPLDLLRVIRDVKPTVVHFAWYRGSRDVSDPDAATGDKDTAGSTWRDAVPRIRLASKRSLPPRDRSGQSEHRLVRQHGAEPVQLNVHRRCHSN